MEEHTSLETEISALGRRIVDAMEGRSPGVFDLDRWEGRLLDAAMKDPEFKTDLFRFVDVLPTLKTNDQVAAHLKEYLGRDDGSVRGLFGAAVHTVSSGAVSQIVARGVRKGVELMARRFIAGRSLEDSLPALAGLREDGFCFSVDLLGEATLGDGEAEACRLRYRDLIDRLPTLAAPWPDDEVLDAGPLGRLPRANISIKVSSLAPHLAPEDVSGGVERLMPRFLSLALLARERGAALHVDLEQSELREVTFSLLEAAASHPALRDWPHLGATVQAYRLSAPLDLERLEALARTRGSPITVRLVKGAYWDSEVARARQNGYPCPVYLDKGSTDASYERLSAKVLSAGDWVHPAFASHNLRSIAHAAACAEAAGVPRSAVEFQMLFGMAEPERAALRSLGYRVRVYTPVGELLPGVAYLVRRLLENTSNEGFLRRAHREGTDLDALLARPFSPRASSEEETEPQGARFDNCPLLDFSDPGVRETFRAAVAAEEQRGLVQVPLVLNGRERHGPDRLTHWRPSQSGREATAVTLAAVEDADQALAGAAAAWPAWRDRPVEERSAVLRALARSLEKDRARLAALEVIEVAKPWAEADADVAEAVDYCRYYAERALEELSDRRLVGAPGEENHLFYEGVGPAVVIAPWNFPLAIPAGMVAAALVAGNTVVFKPAEQSSAIGLALYEHVVAAGVPPGAIQFVPGLGETVGDRLARDPRTAIIAFTGSKAVGLGLWEAAGGTRPGQREVKRVICEMGGKNAVIVDEDADLDAAVEGVVRSTFGYAGQKCSACSRVVTVGDAHAPFLSRLVDAVRSLPLGPAEDPAFRMGPVIDAAAQGRLSEILREPPPGAVLLFQGEGRGGGFYAAPAIFEVSDPSNALMQEELFGPILAVHRTAGFEEALSVAGSTEYALTGAVYSRTPSHLALARRRFRVGNLYLNRGCTGARVGRQPFGGFAMSGAGTKAGGPGYLFRFVNPRCITENTLRRGFAPELAS